MAASPVDSGTLISLPLNTAMLKSKPKKPPLIPAQRLFSAGNCEQNSPWNQFYKYKRLPPVPKFKTKAPSRTEEDVRHKGLPVQYRIGPRVTPEDVRYVQEREEYNKRVFEQWKKGKEASFRAQNRDKSRQETQHMLCLAQLETDIRQLNKAKFHAWLKKKNCQLRSEYVERMTALRKREHLKMQETIRAVVDQEILSTKEAGFQLGGGKLPNSEKSKAQIKGSKKKSQKK